MSAPCEFFEMIGSGVCDRCGKPASAHKGVRTLRDGAGPFGGARDWVDLTWAEWDERVKRDRAVRAARERIKAMDDDRLLALDAVLTPASPDALAEEPT